MNGINLDNSLEFLISSLRIFEPGEHHCTRFCKDDVLYMVYDGVLRFSEDGKNYEIHPGEYHIQKKNSYQSGEKESESPKYLYVHFRGNWADEGNILPRDGKFNITKMMPYMKELDNFYKGIKSNITHIEKSERFYRLISRLFHVNAIVNTANEIAFFINDEYMNITNLDIICEKFNFSKNHIINIFKNEYNKTPFEYINELKIKKAMHLMEVSEKTTESIALECGFNHYSHFYRLFTRTTGKSPKDWRKIILNNQH